MTSLAPPSEPAAHGARSASALGGDGAGVPAGERRMRLLAPATVLLALLVAFAQRPGDAVVDSRIELSTEPGLFLERLLTFWGSTADLGHVEGAQFMGYLVPMAPWYAAWDALGLPIWIAQRLWLAALLAVSAWGVVRLMDALYGRPRGLAHVAAAAVYMLNPYTATYVALGTVVLQAYAALPWLMLAAHRGLAEPRRWRWPVVAGLVLSASAGAVNAAVVFWVLLAPLGLVAYEVLVLRRRAGAAWSLLWRAGVCVATLSAWWVVPVALQGRYGADLLIFTEQPRTIWLTTSLSESIRLLGHWVDYFDVAAGDGTTEPYLRLGLGYLTSTPILVASFLVPLLALGGLRWTLGWRHAPLLGLLAVGALLVMSAGFPEGSPLRGLLTDAYYEVPAAQFLRTTYKAGSVLALTLALLAGAAAPALHARLTAHSRARGRPALRRVVPYGLPVVIALAAFPLVTGRAYDPEQAYGAVPDSWRAAIDDTERTTPPDTRLMVLPGTLLSHYRWGETFASIAPALSERPVAVRELVRFADPRSSQLHATVDDLVQQGRLTPGQLDPLLRLLGVGQVLVGADDRTDRSGALDPAAVAAVLGGQPGFGRPTAEYGERRRVITPGRGVPAAVVPDLRRYRVPSPAGPGIVRVHPAAEPVVVEGDAEGVAALAATNGLDPERALLYAGDVDDPRLDRLLTEGARLVFTDSARRRFVDGTRARDNVGPTLDATAPLPVDLPRYELFPHLGVAGQTVARHAGLRALRGPDARGFGIFPHQRPYAALDGDPDTSWVPGPSVPPADRALVLHLARPQTVGSVRITPHDDPSGRVSAVGVAVDGGPERVTAVGPGPTDVPVGAAVASTLRVRIAGTDGLPPAGGGIAELAVPGLRVRERLRLPTALAERLRGRDLSRSRVDVSLVRATADFPTRAGADALRAEAASGLDASDAEQGIERELTLPAARSFRSVRGWATVRPDADDDALDRVLGTGRPGWRLTSSSRFEGVPANRASAALDGRADTSWKAETGPGRPAWLAVRAPSRLRLRRLVLEPERGAYLRPAEVRVTAPGFDATAPVDANGVVTLPRMLRARGFRLDVLRTAAPDEAFDALRAGRAVAIAEVRGRGLARERAPRRDPAGLGCGALVVRAGVRRLPLRVRASTDALEQGRFLALEPCRARRALALPAGATAVSVAPGAIVRADHLRLVSPATRRTAISAAGAVLTRSGQGDEGKRAGVALRTRAGGWLVLGESYSEGWRAWCRDVRGTEWALGAPVPVDGYANGWRVDADCRSARMAYAPQATVQTGYAVSIVALAVLLGAAGLGAVRRRRPPSERAPADVRSDGPGRPAADPVRYLGPVGIAVTALVTAVVTMPLFSLRAGLVLSLLAAVAAYGGVSARRLVAVAGAALAAIPVAYLIEPLRRDVQPLAGFPAHHMLGHWLAVLAVTALGVSCALAAAALRHAQAGTSATSTPDAV